MTSDGSPGSLKGGSEAAVRALGAGVGGGLLPFMGLDGATGAALGAAASQMAVDAVQGLQRRSAQRRQLQAAVALGTAAKIGKMSLDELVDKLTRNPIKETLAEKLVAAAQDTASRRKLIAIGIQLSHVSSLADDAELNQELVNAASLAALEEPHVAVMELLSRSAEGSTEDSAGIEGHTLAAVATARPELAGVVAPVMAVLALHGLVDELTIRPSDTDYDDRRWLLTGHGRKFLRMFVAAGETATAGEEGMGFDG